MTLNEYAKMTEHTWSPCSRCRHVIVELGQNGNGWICKAFDAIPPMIVIGKMEHVYPIPAEGFEEHKDAEGNYIVFVPNTLVELDEGKYWEGYRGALVPFEQYPEYPAQIVISSIPVTDERMVNGRPWLLQARL